MGEEKDSYGLLTDSLRDLLIREYGYELNQIENLDTASLGELIGVSEKESGVSPIPDFADVLRMQVVQEFQSMKSLYKLTPTGFKVREEEANMFTSGLPRYLENVVRVEKKDGSLTESPAERLYCEAEEFDEAGDSLVAGGMVASPVRSAVSPPPWLLEGVSAPSKVAGVVVKEPVVPIEEGVSETDDGLVASELVSTGGSSGTPVDGRYYLSGSSIYTFDEWDGGDGLEELREDSESFEEFIDLGLSSGDVSSSEEELLKISDDEFSDFKSSFDDINLSGINNLDFGEGGSGYVPSPDGLVDGVFVDYGDGLLGNPSLDPSSEEYLELFGGGSADDEVIEVIEESNIDYDNYYSDDSDGVVYATEEGYEPSEGGFIYPEDSDFDADAYYSDGDSKEVVYETLDDSSSASELTSEDGFIYPSDDAIDFDSYEEPKEELVVGVPQYVSPSPQPSIERPKPVEPVSKPAPDLRSRDEKAGDAIMEGTLKAVERVGGVSKKVFGRIFGGS